MNDRKHPLAECEICPLQHQSCAKTAGPPDAKVAVVSRSPGFHDVNTGRPFAGPAGKILNYLLDQNGYSRKEVLVTNLVLCYSDDPPQAAIAACAKRLESELANVETVIAAGSEAVNVLIGKMAIKSARGLEHYRNNRRFIATNNPAAVLYDSDTFPNLVEDFKLALDPPPEVVYPTVHIIESASEAKFIYGEIAKHDGVIATDLEGHIPTIQCAGFSLDGKEAYVFTREVIQATWSDFKKLYELDKQWLWHNGVYDCKLLKLNEIHSHVTQDTFPLSFVLDERTEGVHGLEYLARTQLGWKNYEPSSVEHYKDTGELPEDISELYTYNGYDCAGTYQLYHILKERAIKDEVWQLYLDRYPAVMNAIVDVELRGFTFDDVAASDLNEEVVLPKLRDLTKQMSEIVGLDFFNPRSNQQVQAFMYDTCGLTHKLKDTKKRKFSRSASDPVRVEILEGRFDCKSRYQDKLVNFTEIYDVYQEIDKQRSTYIEALIKLVADDGKLYCSFNPCGTVTGRWSSRKPNFQNITRTGKDVVPGIRTIFKPSPGNTLIQADYSQAELRCIAKFSGDPELSAIYRDTNRSLHKETAAAFYGAKYTKDQYVRSKNINFGVCYGQSAFAFAQMYHMDQKEAQAYIDAWFQKFPLVRKWIDEVHLRAISGEAIVNPFGRKRRFYLITDENIEDVKREAVNFLPQSTATADFTPAALAKLNAMGVPIVNTVHDSIIADVPTSDAMEVALLMKSVMEAQPAELLGWEDIPFIVDISMSDVSWGDVEEIEWVAA